MEMKLFQNKYTIENKLNLVIIITPYIVPKSEDLTYIRKQLSQLKALEDKYTKETILKLEKNKLQSKKDNIKRNEELADIKEEISELSPEEDNDEYEGLTENERLHQQRMKTLFGI